MQGTLALAARLPPGQARQCLQKGHWSLASLQLHARAQLQHPSLGQMLQESLINGYTGPLQVRNVWILR